jgi:hypothetical protein
MLFSHNFALSLPLGQVKIRTFKSRSKKHSKEAEVGRAYIMRGRDEKFII